MSLEFTRDTDARQLGNFYQLSFPDIDVNVF